MVQTIFETNSRKEVIKRFLENYSHGYTEFFTSVSGEYINGINALHKAVNDLQVNDKLIETASGYFAIATKKTKGKTGYWPIWGKSFVFISWITFLQ